MQLVIAVLLGSLAKSWAVDCDCHSTCTGWDLIYNCGNGPEDAWSNPCLREDFRLLPFCNPSLSIPDRVADLLSRIPMDEKLGSAGTSTPLSNYATEMPSVGMKYSQWWSEALHGVALSPGVLFDESFPFATSFPQIISTSHSFNRSLFAAIGATIGTEIRAFSNAGKAGLTYWTPNLNIFRDPRWGRGQETPGEDPYLSSEYVSYYVPALQYDAAIDPNHLKVSACCKHFDAYSLENYEGMDRHHFNAVVDAQDFADTYTPAFEACVSPEKGGGSCIMCSYNELNGVPACANRDLLTTLARERWAFDGYITSDCGAVEDIYSTHQYASTPEEALQDALDAGMDTECGQWMDLYLRTAVETGVVGMDLVNRALTNLLTIHMRLGRFDTQGTGFDAIDEEFVNTEKSQQLALEAAQQSIVLLKNVDLALPLVACNSGQIAVIGPNANASDTLLGNYYGVPPYIITPLLAISDEVGAVTYSKGCDINTTSTVGFADAIATVEESDTIILIMGIDQTIEAEGLDRTSISLPGVQSDLIERVLDAAAGKKVVLVIISGGAICLNAFSSDPRVGAILFAGYGGQSGGQGISDVIFGRVSPSGRLTQTFYSEAYLSEVSFLDMNMRPRENYPGRGYRFYAGDSVVYEFGYGLSYTSFEYKWVYLGVVSNPLMSDPDAVVVNISINVSNTGEKITASETVLVFLTPPSVVARNVTLGAPRKILRNFDKIRIHPGSSNVVQFALTNRDFSLADENGQFNKVLGKWTVTVGPLVESIVIK